MGEQALVRQVTPIVFTFKCRRRAFWACLNSSTCTDPTEHHKGPQRSVALQLFEADLPPCRARLFRVRAKSEKKQNCPTGGRRETSCGRRLRRSRAVRSPKRNGCHPRGLYMLERHARARSRLGARAFSTLGREATPEFRPLPPELGPRSNQYFTQARHFETEECGWGGRPLSIEDGLRRYFEDFLTPDPIDSAGGPPLLSPPPSNCDRPRIANSPRRRSRIGPRTSAWRVTGFTQSFFPHAFLQSCDPPPRSNGLPWAD